MSPNPVVFYYITGLPGQDGDCPQCDPWGPLYLFFDLCCLFWEAARSEVRCRLPTSLIRSSYF